MNKETQNKTSELIEQLVMFSGLSRDLIESELRTILEKKDLKLEDLTLEQLRNVTASYVRQTVKSILG